MGHGRVRYCGHGWIESEIEMGNRSLGVSLVVEIVEMLRLESDPIGERNDSARSTLLNSKENPIYCHDLT